MELTGKTALVTGGGTGVGRATCLLLAKQGCHIVVNYSKSKNEAEATVADVKALQQQAIAIQTDVADDKAVADMFTRVDRELNGVDVLVNCAATTQFVAYDDLDGLTSELWDNIYDVNVKGLFYCCRGAIKSMRRRGQGGSIVNVSSIAGITGIGSSIAYASSKAAVNCMTRSLAISGAPDINVNAVAPGVIETRWIKGWEQYTDKHLEATPLKRHASPEDIAQAIYSLIANPYITGQTINVDGGRTLGVS